MRIRHMRRRIIKALQKRDGYRKINKRFSWTWKTYAKPNNDGGGQDGALHA